MLGRGCAPRRAGGPGARGRWLLAGALVAVALVVGGCGSPPGLDSDESAVQARSCAGLILRSAERAHREGRPTEVVLDGVAVDPFRDPAAFRAHLVRVRGPDRFPGDAPAADLTSSATALIRACRPDRPDGSDGSDPDEPRDRPDPDRPRPVG